jgi:putative membrane protein
MRLFVMVLCCSTLLMVAASAQEGNPAFKAQDAPLSAQSGPGPKQANAQDRLFALLAASGGMAEVGAGKLAERKGSGASVKEFAGRMVQDHTKANDQLADIAKPGNIPLPTELDPEHRAMQADLEKLSGPEFDVAYMRAQVQEHQKTAQLLEWEIGSGQDMALVHFASETLPKVLEHLQLAQHLIVPLATQVHASARAASGGRRNGEASEGRHR